MRVLCDRCGVWMKVVKMGVTVRPKGYMFGFHADLYKCPKCGKTILITADQEDPYIKKPEIVWLRDEEEEEILEECERESVRGIDYSGISNDEFW